MSILQEDPPDSLDQDDSEAVYKGSSLYQEQKSPLGKILVATTLLLIVIGVGTKWLMTTQSEQKIIELMAVSKDQFNNEQPEKALSTINLALALKETSEVLETKFEILRALGRDYEAEVVLNQLIKQSPNKVHYHTLAGTFAHNEGRDDVALEHYKKAIELEPHDTDYQMSLADIYADSGQFEKSKEIYEKLLKADPKYTVIWQQYAQMYIEQEKYDDAIQLILTAMAQLPGRSDLAFLLATAYDYKEDKANAVKFYKQSLELEPLADSMAAQRIFEITGKRVPLALENMTTDKVPFESEGKLMYIITDVNNQRGRFLVDTGASHSVIYNNVINKYKIGQTRALAEIQTAGGTTQAGVGYADIRLGGNTFQNARVLILDPPKSGTSDGIIGMNVLSHFRFEVDKNNNTIILEH